VTQSLSAPAAFVGIRAHHLEFLEADEGSGAGSGPGSGAGSSEDSGGENVLPCWLVRSSETPFRVTLYLTLNQPPSPDREPQLLAEVYKEKWQRFRDKLLPWKVRLRSDALFLMKE
jgi:molybdate transport system permease protein